MFLQVNNLSIHYAGAAAPAVSNLSLSLERGQIGVLIGPSGSGKTTLLRALAGLEPVTQGDIYVDQDRVGSSNFQLAPESRRIGMVFQDYALFPHMTVAENVAFGLFDWPRSKSKEKANLINEMLELVDLSEFSSRYPHELSGGQQQRAALARALAPKPRLLLLDEPFSNLDVELRERLAHEIRGILLKAKITALMVTHDQLEAFAVGDVIGVMNESRLEQWSDPYTLYHRPLNRFVASFIGHGVFLPARLDAGDLPQLKTVLGNWPLPNDAISLHQSNDAINFDLLVRADDVIHDDDSSVQAKIIRKAFRGSEFLYTLKLLSGETILAHVPSHHDHQLNEWIGIRLLLDHIVVFPAKSNQGR
jgi:iron(III) transport system ATP-binding protein